VSLTVVEDAGVVVDAADAVDTAGVVVDTTGVVVDPTGVAVWSQPTQAISIALIRMMDLSRCMWPLYSLLSWNGALDALAQRPERASDERGRLVASAVSTAAT
jgi:hypothetical protein